MAVTIPSANGITTIAPGTGDVLQLAALIGNKLFNLGPLDEITTVTSPPNPSFPPAPTTPGATQTLEINSPSSISGTVPQGYQYVVDYGTARDNLSVANTFLITGTTGGSFNLSGNSTIAATGGNNFVSGTGNYLMSFGPGNNVIYAAGVGTVATDVSPSSAIIISGSIDGSGSNSISSAGDHDLVIAVGSTTVDATGPSFQLLGDGGAVTASVSGDGATVSAANSDTSITTAGSDAVVFGGIGASAGMLNVDNTGSNNTISTFDSQATISSSGSNDLIFGGSAATSVDASGTNDSIVGGTGAITVDASSAVQLFGSTGPISFVGGAGTSSILGADGGSEEVTVSSGGVFFSAGSNNTSTFVTDGGTPGFSTIFGGDNSVVNFDETVSGTANGAVMDAGSGNETLNAALSNTNNTLAGSSDPNATASLVGGSGTNTFFAGAAGDTMTGGSNTNIFGFFANQISANASFVVTDFSSNDSLDLIGFDPTQSLSSILANATTGPNGLTITLSDNVTITFSNLTDTSLLASKTIYT